MQGAWVGIPIWISTFKQYWFKASPRHQGTTGLTSISTIIYSTNLNPENLEAAIFQSQSDKMPEIQMGLWEFSSSQFQII